MPFSLDRLRRCTVAVDLGAARTRVHIKQSGLVVDEPSCVAVNTYSGALIAVGAAAERMAGRTPEHIRVVRPVTGGMVVDIEMAQRMLRALVGEKVRRAWRRRPTLRAAVCVPHNADPLARRAAVETLAGVGARRVELVDAPTAAGVGCGLPVEQPQATMILVCGATTTQVAVLSLGAIVAAVTVPMGGDTINNALVQHLRNHHELMLPSQAVRPLHRALNNSATPSDAPTEVHGRDVVTGMARTILVDPQDVRSAVQAPMTGLLDAIRGVLHRCPPDLVADLADRGMMLTGGMALLPGLDDRLRENTGMSVHIADEPAGCVVRGLAAMTEGGVRPFAPGGGRPDARPQDSEPQDADGRHAEKQTAEAG
ncbi:rod shape-determining protein [Streptomyces armeniacus]|uniref:Cell shape-determining protein MreB n=1 Tax=Streptomyces armeniacus TaxID=83291 RepID=A0A345XPM7_9ACTN|nr:rod shape-determining protein [Streptomyces armeniacus]AXK33593.1 rod shape-determining protein [Streptomyces armeniacus]